MNFRILILSLLALTGTVYARTKTDVLVMSNGDHLTCEIKGLDSGILYVSFDYILSTQSVQWSKVDHIESKQLFLVRTENGSVYTGTLSTPTTFGEQPVKIEIAAAPERVTVVERRQVVKMEETSQKFWQRFNGSINFGLTYSKGNQSTQYNLSSDVSYPRERWSAQAGLNSTLTSSTGASASTRNGLDFSGQRLLRRSNWFYSGVGEFLQSSEQGINLETTLGGSVGRYLKNTNNATISVAAGLAWQSTDYQQAGSQDLRQNVTAAMFVGNVKLFRFNKTNLTLDGVLLPALNDAGRVHITTNATYYVKVFSNLKWNVSFYGNWDSKPPAGFSGSDYGTTSGLGWTFGTK
jgi:Protein of unknown function, DUF481